MALVKIIFTKKFANKNKGEVGEYDSSLASNLVRHEKVAKYFTEGGFIGLGKKSKNPHKIK